MKKQELCNYYRCSRLYALITCGVAALWLQKEFPDFKEQNNVTYSRLEEKGVKQQ
ncbi:hypothetical protein BCR33DRAFT_717916 [Rhizoclosmatium globosum]|uniref:Uncharacterized protein n=1 Tax=Rhizoclosmatium globosum TaxID=329046 RepID=A0A1Y2C700_9FUNG|nr:hypothetical protein BCR33DRAFT_717916 [Rhizoclosmatium globosum]|eukprot:ORY42726.1 hypothetical protein BCR33DRAFT_717916 [Rhizoclosmatium globosum]